MEFKTYLEQIENKYQYFIDKFALACEHANAQLVSIGKVGEYDLYKATLPARGPGICFIGAVHGNEVSGSYAILKFLEEGKASKRVTLFPIANPIGFENQTRTATDRLNINRQFDKDNLENESKLLRNALENEKFDLLCTFHEDSAAKGFYVYYGNPKHDNLAKKIVEVAKEFMPVDTRKVIYRDKVKNGTILVDIEDEKPQNAKALDTWMYKMGTDYVCVELPSQEPLEKRAACGKAIIEFLTNTPRY